MGSLANFFLLSFGSQDADKAKLHWLVKLRWLALLGLSLISIPAFLSHFLDARTLPIFLGAVGLLFGFNLLTQGVWLSPSARMSSSFLLVQLTLDLVVLTGLLLMSGGMNNPFYILFYLNMSLGAVLLSDRRGFIYLFWGHAALALVQLATFWGDSLPWIPLGTQHLILFLSFTVSRSLGSVLAGQQEQLAQAL